MIGNPMKVLTIRRDESATIEIHLLNAGEKFANFDGTKHTLTAGRDFVTGRKNRPQTASLVLRQHGRAGFYDREMSIIDPSFWEWMAKLIAADTTLTVEG